jgi:hypothetical protein
MDYVQPLPAPFKYCLRAPRSKPAGRHGALEDAPDADEQNPGDNREAAQIRQRRRVLLRLLGTDSQQQLVARPKPGSLPQPAEVCRKAFSSRRQLAWTLAAPGAIRFLGVVLQPRPRFELYLLGDAPFGGRP